MYISTIRYFFSRENKINEPFDFGGFGLRSLAGFFSRQNAEFCLITRSMDFGQIFYLQERVG